MEEIRLEDEAEKAAGFISIVKLFRIKSLRWQLISIIVLMGGQQLSGVNAVGGGLGLGWPGTGAAWGEGTWGGAAGSGQAVAWPAHQHRGCLPDLLLRG